MAPTEIAPDKIAAYHATDYCIRFGLDAITLRICNHAPKLGAIYDAAKSSCGVVITAYNPFGEVCDAATNLAAQTRLEEHLGALAPMVLEASGAHPTGAWPPEPSFFALGINHETARLLGTRFRQDAVVWVGANAIPELLLLR